MFDWWKAQLLSEHLEPERRRRAISRSWKSALFFTAATILWVPLWVTRAVWAAGELSLDARLGLMFSTIVLLLAVSHYVRELNLLVLVDALERRAGGPPGATRPPTPSR
jgi:hypothetical protein